MTQTQNKIRPSKKQLEFLSWEFGLFFHFGIRTFYPERKDWDMKQMSAQRFCPSDLDCEEWIKAASDAGAKYAVFTAKHHDGFANWPSKYTEFSVKNSPWKDGKGDVVAEFTEACRKYGLKVGIYYSPADYKLKNEPITAKIFEDYFIAQISELLSGYGKIDYLWFDGCGSEGLIFDKQRIVNVIRTLQPGILIFNMWEPDVRWIGNEEGFAPANNPSVVDRVDFSIRTDIKEKLGAKIFLPAECDARMRSTHWFTADDSQADTVKSVERLMDIYDSSVGHGANLLLNIGPAADGRLPKRDKERLLEFGKALKTRFASPVLEYTGPDIQNGTVCLELSGEAAVNTLVIEEDLTEGEAVKGFCICADGTEVYRGKTVGNKAICKFKTTLCKKITVSITESNDKVNIRRIRVFFDGSAGELKIAHVFEPDPLQCGQAVLAMLSGKSVDEIIELCGTQRETTLADMKRVLNICGIEYENERRQVTRKEELPQIALLSLETPKCWHWSLYLDGLFYDPEYGVLKDFPPSYRRYYWRIKK